MRTSSIAAIRAANEDFTITEIHNHEGLLLIESTTAKTGQVNIKLGHQHKNFGDLRFQL